MAVLSGIRIIEVGGIGPGSMAAMLLADMGATVLRVDRPRASDLGLSRPTHTNFVNRGRRSVVVDLKSHEGVGLMLELVARADALIEGFRPGKMEKLGLGPEDCSIRNPALVYGRMTGWGQDGPLAQAAGHDLNYIAMSGALHAIGRAGQPPSIPLNLIGDYGGALYLCMGVLAALLAVRSGRAGQVVDASMLDAATSMMTSTYGMHAADMHRGPRGTNMLDSGCPYYDVYECADGEFVSIAAIESRFRRQLFERMNLDPTWLERSSDSNEWPALRRAITARFLACDRDHWCQLLEGTDACFAPVLSMQQAMKHPHHVAREGFISINGLSQPSPAPRFGGESRDMPLAPEHPGQSADQAMAEWGFSEAEVAHLRSIGALLHRDTKDSR